MPLYRNLLVLMLVMLYDCNHQTSQYINKTLDTGMAMLMLYTKGQIQPQMKIQYLITPLPIES